VTWNTRPGRLDSLIADVAKVVKGTWVEWNVTQAVGGNGTFSFAVAADSTDGTDFRSREAGSDRPQLIVEFAG
jgi:hypothetical protein